MRPNIIAGNWKMNKVFEEASDFLIALSEFLELQNVDRMEVIVCPPAVYLELATDISVESAFAVGAQNVNENEFGAYTGEISAPMLSSLELSYCIVGHSERRQYYAEKDKIINLKIKALHEYAITPILCIGETLEQRESDKTKQVIEMQLKKCLKDVNMHNETIIAYEPVWAIGTGKNATPEQAQEIHGFIRDWLRNNYDEDIADNTPIIYGGSMAPDNLEGLLAQPDIDGGLIGGASLEIENFTKMIEMAQK